MRDQDMTTPLGPTSLKSPAAVAHRSEDLAVVPERAEERADHLAGRPAVGAARLSLQIYELGRSKVHRLSCRLSVPAGRRRYVSCLGAGGTPALRFLSRCRRDAGATFPVSVPAGRRRYVSCLGAGGTPALRFLSRCRRDAGATSSVSSAGGTPALQFLREYRHRAELDRSSPG